ncbi:GntR family transcriptional repressor for pyruvate dehydrogenase complex [Sphingopyxis sp. OAS728]|uniref:FadR/GntR family transcriptional regulator n=1 Tax=Sphingopyxis sp. OAS728 TaxID=2663823 RepID=UPI00178ABEF5|nr:FadR/GntR family transcriptional regulator [Sphingopyxis sp. OAS728]MBE1527309.1 GntR family transcriptional repressor for pyruvate dehydrogenase complex [Sphingopyxis sp. OAS728]
MAPNQKLYQRIADEIAAKIASGVYQPGTRLPAERDLAEQFEVSRPTIREAMIALEIRGLVGARKGSGIYVSTTPLDTGLITPELDVGAFELIEARTLFESEAAALAAATIDAPQLAELRALLGEMEQQGDTDAAFEADKRFHIAIAAASGNSLIVSVIEMLWAVREQSPLCVHMFARARRKGVTPRANEHELIVDALAQRDPQLARDAMRAHLRRVTDDLLDATKLELMEKAEADFAEQLRRVDARKAV